MIKKYLEFISESVDGRDKFNSLGEWIEYLYSKFENEDLEYLKNIINRNLNVGNKDDLNDIPSNIRLLNAINILDDKSKNEIESLINDYLENGIPDKEPVVEFSTDLEELSENVTSGKNIFKSFLKCITALGGKDVSVDFVNCPNDYIFFYEFKSLSENVKMIFNRFSSLRRYIDLIPYDLNDISIYYSININGELEYGFKSTNLIPFGYFKLNNSTLKWLLFLDLKSAFNLKKDLVNYTLKDLLLIGKIKKDLNDYKPSYYEKKSEFIIKDRIITIGYYGIGKWDNGKLDSGEFSNIKQNFNNWILTKNWGQNVQYNVKSNSFWVYLNLKIK